MWDAYTTIMEQQEIDALGSRLSLEIGCPVRYPAYGKLIFECVHGVIFPRFVVEQYDWEYIKDKHTVESRMAN